MSGLEVNPLILPPGKNEGVVEDAHVHESQIENVEEIHTLSGHHQSIPPSPHVTIASVSTVVYLLVLGETASYYSSNDVNHINTSV